jgi:hypothetical protein
VKQPFKWPGCGNDERQQLAELGPSQSTDFDQLRSTYLPYSNRMWR